MAVGLIAWLIESSLANVKPDDKFQFERNGYIVADLKDHSQEMPVFNLAVTLRSARSASK
jgi:glutaminyl-tRNA synthetase